MDDLHGRPDGSPASSEARRYAKLGVRVRAALYDWMILITGVVLCLTLAISSDSGAAAKMIGVAGVVLFLLYEPVMVWRWGSTLGHMAGNLRIVDDRSLGNPSLGKAALRFVVKTLLSWYSFITIMASRRLRAVHDVLTGTTVQVRNASGARTYDFATERSAPQGGKRISGLRRTASIVIYLIASFLAVGLIMALLSEFRLISVRCLDGKQCSSSEELILSMISLAWLACLFLIVGLGWRGKLLGFRAR
jgi:uncharacterized RDD family membrane protein YckC